MTDAQDAPDAPDAAAAQDAEARRRRRQEVFGEVLPESTRDDRDPADPGDGPAPSDEWLKANVPPHHG